MSFGLNQLHDVIDKQFEGKKESEKIIFYALPFLLFAYLSYQFLIPKSNKFIAKKAAEQKAIEVKLEETKGYLKNKHLIDRNVKNIETQIKTTESKLKEKAEANRHLTEQFAAMDFIRLNEENALIFADYLTTQAGKNGVVINNMETNISSQERGVFKKEMTTEIGCTGGFTGMLSFINAIESSKMFSKIEKIMVLGGGRELNTSMSIKVNGL